MLRIVIVFGLLAIVGGIATWRPDLAEQAYVKAQSLIGSAKPGGTQTAEAPRPAQGGQPQRAAPPAVPVNLARVEKRSMPIVVDAVGTVQSMASIQIKPRIDTQVAQVHVAEGAQVKQGDLLFTLDDRTLKAQLAQLEAQIERTKAQIEQATRDRDRTTDLFRRGVGTEVARDNATSTLRALVAQLMADHASRDNISTQLSFTVIRAPVSGRIGSISTKPGALVRSADVAAMTTVNQMDPIFIAFAVPQATFYELRSALGTDPTQIKVEANVGGQTAFGTVAFVENQVDLATGTVTAKARMVNGTEVLWPGAYVPVKITLGFQADAIVIPTAALQVGQNGSYVFTAKDGRATVANVTVARTLGDRAIIASGLVGGEDVITSGQLRLTNGVAVVARPTGAAANDTPSRDRQS
jgi:multidrug efflux system membrane fusion protein